LRGDELSVGVSASRIRSTKRMYTRTTSGSNAARWPAVRYQPGTISRRSPTSSQSGRTGRSTIRSRFAPRRMERRGCEVRRAEWGHERRGEQHHSHGEAEGGVRRLRREERVDVHRERERALRGVAPSEAQGAIEQGARTADSVDAAHARGNGSDREGRAEGLRLEAGEVPLRCVVRASADDGGEGRRGAAAERGR